MLSGLAGKTARVDPAALTVFLEELFRWNPQIGLVSKRETASVVVRLIRESIDLWDFLAGELGEARVAGVDRIVDIGSGGGFPGIVWKLISPEHDVVLIERKERKVAFLEHAIVRAKLTGISAVAVDIREAARQPAHEHAYDLAAMMAVVDPRRVAASIERVLRKPGYFCTTRGREQEFPGERLRGLALLARSDTDLGRFLLYQRDAGE